MPQITAQQQPNSPIAPANKQQSTIGEAQVASPEATTTEVQEALPPKIAEILAKKERALRQQQRQFEAQRKAFEEQQKAKPSEPQADAWKSKIKQDFWGVMSDAGYTPDEITQMMLNQPGPQDLALRSIQQELKLAHEEINKLKSGQEESVSQSREAAKKQILHDVSMLVDRDETYEAIKVYGDSAKQAVVELIEKTFDEQGFVMDTEDAIKEIEEYYIEESLKAARLKKVQEKLNPPQVQEEAPKQLTQTQKPQPQTLSNRMVQSMAKPLTDKERRERAIAAFQGQLK